MKNLFIAMLLSFPNLLFGQILLHDTIIVNDIDPFGPSDINFANTITNNYNIESEFNWSFNVIEKEDEWEVGVCDINMCYSPNVTTAEFELEAEQSGYVDTHVYLNERYEGYAEIELTVEKIGFVSSIVTALLVLDVKSVGVIESTISDFKFYPNPVIDEIQFDDIGDAEYVQIYNSIGAEVMSFNLLKRNRVSVSGLNKGVYFLTFFNNKNQIVGSAKIAKK